mgnify:CR=1 FL=1
MNGTGSMTRGQAAIGLLIGAVVLTVAQYIGWLPNWMHRLPETAIPNFAMVLDIIFNFVKDDPTRSIGPRKASVS